MVITPLPTPKITPFYKSTRDKHLHPTINIHNNEDLTFICSTGINPLSDFPYCREDCVIYSLQQRGIRSEQYCHNCYCFVCDERASDYNKLKEHCKAGYSSSMWKKEREKVKRTKTLEVTSKIVKKRGMMIKNNTLDTLVSNRVKTRRWMARKTPLSQIR